MKSYQVIGIIVACLAFFVGTVAFLAWQGVPLLLAPLAVYLVAVGSLLTMQHRACGSCKDLEYRHVGRRARRRRPEPPSMMAQRVGVYGR